MSKRSETPHERMVAAALDLGPNVIEPTGLNTLLGYLLSNGWIVCPPSAVPVPRSRGEAKMMRLLADRYLQDNRLFPEGVE